MDRKVLLIGSGGLSHDVPIPRLRQATPDVAAYLVSKRRNPAEQQAREETIYQAGQDFARGESTLMPLNPDLDKQILQQFEKGDDLSQFDTMSEWLGDKGGSSIHEMTRAISTRMSSVSSGSFAVRSAN